MKLGFVLLVVCVITTVFSAPVKLTSFDDYVFNWNLWFISTNKLISCTFVGLFGLFWFNDNGAMAEKCF